MKMLFAAIGVVSIAYAQGPMSSAGALASPRSNSVTSQGNKVFFHTNLHVIAAPPGANVAVQAAGSPPFSGYLYETPASIGCVYRLVSHARGGCNPNTVTTNPTGGVGAIAIVDAYDDPTAASDLAAFSKQFSLPAADFTVVYAGAGAPGLDSSGGWELEESLDIQWAHAMAPQAKIYLVEADSDSAEDLLAAVLLASTLPGVAQVSMSWSGDEFADEGLLDSVFTVPGVVYFSGAGDSPGTQWPAVSPNVVAAGGTSLSRDPGTGAFFFESVWQSTGGGLSAYEPRPSFQDSIRHLVGNHRGVPDLSFDADPNSGVWIYATSGAGGAPKGWYVVGGTSVSSPALAGITNAAGAMRVSSAAENAHSYRNRSNFRDVYYGNCGKYLSDFASEGWDFCTGLGSPMGARGY